MGAYKKIYVKLEPKLIDSLMQNFRKLTDHWSFKFRYAIPESIKTKVK